MPRPAPTEPWVHRHARWPQSLWADVTRIAAAESTSVAELERDWLELMVALYDNGLIGDGELSDV